MSVSTALIACANGLGHVRRVLLIASELNEIGVEVTVFAPSKSVQKIKTSLQLEIKYCVRDFDTWTSIPALRDGDPRALNWEQRLPDISSFDFVVSDNLPEILEIRPDAWLSGNFLWHEVLSGISRSYSQRARSLLEAYEPNLLTYGGFSAVNDINNLQITECAIPNPIINQSEVLKDSLLITSGTGGEAESSFRDFVKSLTKDTIKPFSQVFVEPSLVPQDCKSWMLPASFTANMFCKTLVAICRPGFGILSDCLLYNIRMITLFEKGNHEMVRNTNFLESAGLGEKSNDFTAALFVAHEYASDPRRRELQGTCSAHFFAKKYPKVSDVLFGLNSSNVKITHRSASHRK